MSKLNPCPRCGSEPDIFERSSRDISFQASCGECGDETFIVSNSANGAINAWNSATGEQPAKTLLDEFAMSALTGLLANSGGPMQKSCQSGWALVNCNMEDIATFSYMMAREMLKERERDQNEP